MRKLYFIILTWYLLFATGKFEIYRQRKACEMNRKNFAGTVDEHRIPWWKDDIPLWINRRMFD